MDNSASEWSSGCESGWTVYLDESSHSYQRSALDHQSYRLNADDEDDLSMVSDASSAPPHFHYGVREDEEVECHGRAPFPYPPSSSSEKSKKTKKAAKKPLTSKNQHHSFLDDTASSPAFSYPNQMCTDPSNNQPSMNHLFGFSHNGFAGNSSFGNQFGYWQSSSQPRQQDSTEPSRPPRGRRRG